MIPVISVHQVYLALHKHFSRIYLSVPVVLVGWGVCKIQMLIVLIILDSVSPKNDTLTKIESKTEFKAFLRLSFCQAKSLNEVIL